MYLSKLNFPKKLIIILQNETQAFSFSYTKISVGMVRVDRIRIPLNSDSVNQSPVADS